jgi:hypothetical protein
MRARSFRKRHGMSRASKIKMIVNQKSTRGSGCCKNLMSLSTTACLRSSALMPWNRE